MTATSAPIIDAHQHVWDPRRAEYAWLDESLAPINRPIAFDELLPSLRRAGVDATVIVQSADNADDTALMIETADAHPEIAGIVAWVPLERPAEAAAMLRDLADDERVVGVRCLIHNQPDPDWLLGAEVDRGLALLEEVGLTFDVVAVLPRHLELVPIVGARHPGLDLVIDHLAKPPIGLDDREPWWSLLAAAAENPRVFAKVSGLYAATADSGSWTPELVRPFLHHGLDVFGADRLMYGGDWPISVLSGGYDRVWSGLSELFAELDPGDRNQILGATAARFYRLDAAVLRRAIVVQGE